MKARLDFQGSSATAQVESGKYAFRDAKIIKAILNNKSKSLTISISESADYYPATAEINAGEAVSASNEEKLSFALPPRKWEILSGNHAGETVDIRLVDAFESNSTSDFYKVRIGILSSILEKDRPLLTAFNREESDQEIAPKDSINYWENIRLMEDYLGFGELFRPANIEDVPTTLDGVHVRTEKGEIKASPSTLPGGFIVGGRVTFPNTIAMRTLRPIAHENIHVLGLGHTCRWASAMTQQCKDQSLPSGFPTKYDVGHIQLLYEMREFRLKEIIRFGIIEAYGAVK